MGSGTGSNYEVESSPDLRPDSWGEVTDGDLEVIPDGAGEGFDRVTLTWPGPGVSRRFLRVRAELGRSP